ncbi:MAG: arginase [Bacteroidota bacterium]|nr:arginase [Bacteroidota bacterium]
MGKTKILICSSEVGAGKRGASLGPDAIRIEAVNQFFNIFDRLPSEEVKVSALNKYTPETKQAKYIKQIVSTHGKISSKMCKAHKEGYNTIIFSGDHSNAAGFFNGFREAYPTAKLGLIWIDAHGDLHSPYTSPSGNVHGMPVSILLGLDNLKYQRNNLKPEVKKNWEKIKKMGSLEISPKLNPEDIIFIDIRDLEKEEWALIEELQIKHYTPAIRREIGVQKIIEETIAYFKDYDGMYISFDVDSMDPSISTGTGTPVPDGLKRHEAAELLKAFVNMKNFKSLEITEVNPLLDTENKMAYAVVKILKDALNEDILTS